MQIEAFSQAKDPGAPHTNEDRLVILPGRAYAVIDGVTDRLGTRYDGVLSGQFAATVLQSALENLLSAPGVHPEPLAIVGALTQQIHHAYLAHGMLEKAKGDLNVRLAAALALVLVEETTIVVVLAGDSGVRINHTNILRMEKDLDLITATLRREAWPIIGRTVSDPVLHERVSRQITWHGTHQDLEGLAGSLDAADVAEIERLAIAANVTALPHVPRLDIENLVTGGIVNAQGGYQNDPSRLLGYPCLDGFPIPASLIRVETFPRDEVDTIEIFSDGYFKPGDAFGVASWEQAFAEAERDDPAKVFLYSSPKGSVGGTWADDRSYLGVKF